MRGDLLSAKAVPYFANNAQRVIPDFARDDRWMKVVSKTLERLAYLSRAHPLYGRSTATQLFYSFGVKPSFNSIRVPQGSVRNATFKWLEFWLARTGSSILMPWTSSFLTKASRFLTSNPM